LGGAQWCAWVARELKRKLAPALPGGLALAGLAASTWIAFRLGQSFAFTGFVHLIIVVLAAMYGGFWQATVISIGAAACLNYFFVPPIFSFVNSPANWVALGAFEFTALVISRLSERAQLRAMEAIAERRDMERLYETSRRILLLESSGEPGSLITALIQEMFALKAVRLFDALAGATYQSGSCESDADQQTRNAYLLGTDTYHPATRSWYCALRLGTRPVGGLALNDTQMSKQAATALASLSGIALERLRTLQRESRAEVARQTEQLRTAVLDALAHAFKSPLTVARTASSGLLAVGGLSELQTEMVTVIDQQARELEHLTSRLLRAAMLDGAEFKPQRESLLFSDLVGAAIQRLDRETDRSRFRVSVPELEVAILADRELMLTALAQLIDNALKYSEAGSPVAVTFAVKDTAVVATMRSKGIVVARQDCDRIFERFYRTAEAEHLPAGTGLGLSVVKKIVSAQYGTVWAEGEAGYGTSMCISLPTAPWSQT